MRKVTAFLTGILILASARLLCAQGTSSENGSAQLERGKLPGRQVKAAAICIGFGGEHDAKLKLAIEHLHTAGKNGVDIACLPEEFAGTGAEPIPGPTTKAVAELAKRYNMYVICPIREEAGDKQYNTAVLIDRKGQVCGCYRKVFVFWGEGLHCSKEGVKVFQTDFGKIGILTCFDLNFPELWQKCDALGAEIVFWPSAYGGGSPLNAYAVLYHYYVVPVGAGNIIDVTGKTLASTEKPMPKQFIATLDLDRAFVHHDFNRERVKKMLDEHKDEIIVERNLSDEDLAPWWLFKAIKPGVHVRDLLKKYDIETLRDYQHRSRKQINEARENGKRI
jgi:predicted amidohydrolase